MAFRMVRTRSELLSDSYEFGIRAWKRELVGKTVPEVRIEAIPKDGNLVRIRPALSIGFVESSFKSSNELWYGFGDGLFQGVKSIFSVMCLVWVIIHTS